MIAYANQNARRLSSDASIGMDHVTAVRPPAFRCNFEILCIWKVWFILKVARTALCLHGGGTRSLARHFMGPEHR